MNKITSYNGIGYVAATFPVSSTLQEYLKTNHTNASTGNVDVNGKNFAVKLNEKGELEFGSSSPAETDKLLGIMIAYEMDGFASVQLKGGVDLVPTKEELKAGVKALGVNDKGQIEALDSGTTVVVASPSTSENLFASIIL